MHWNMKEERGEYRVSVCVSACASLLARVSFSSFIHHPLFIYPTCPGQCISPCHPDCQCKCFAGCIYNKKKQKSKNAKTQRLTRRTGFAGLDSAPLTPSSSSPHTPLPYVFAVTPDSENGDPLVSRVKRLRADSVDSISSTVENEIQWTDEEIDTLQSVSRVFSRFLHLYEVLRGSYTDL